MGTHYEKGTPEEKRALNAFIAFARAGDSLIARLTPDLGTYRLTESQFGVLEALLHLGPMCQASLAQKILKSGGNLTFVIDNLEKNGLVTRVRSLEDRRFVTVDLTPKGRRLIARVFPKHVKRVVEEMSILTHEEQEILRALCRKLGKAEKQDDKTRRHHP